MDLTKEDKLQGKINTLEKWFKNIEKAAIALSGGIDSSLVAFAARKYLGKDKTLAIISASSSLKRKDLIEARNFCKKFDIHLEEIDSKEIEDPNYSSNPIDRCFYCKSALYQEMERLIEKKYPGHTVLNGNNYTDFSDYRPGLKASSIFKAKSPLAECEYTKEDIRLVSKEFGLPNYNKPASPCLSSRFPYGERITVDKLHLIENAEDILNTYGFEDVRVRYKGELASIEVEKHEIERLNKIYEEVGPKIKGLGFDEVVIDPEGLVSGKLNRAIGK